MKLARIDKISRSFSLKICSKSVASAYISPYMEFFVHIGMESADVIPYRIMLFASLKRVSSFVFKDNIATFSFIAFIAIVFEMFTFSDLFFPITWEYFKSNCLWFESYEKMNNLLGLRSSNINCPTFSKVSSKVEEAIRFFPSSVKGIIIDIF